MKRIITLLAVLCLLLCACGTGTETPVSTAATTEVTTEATTQATTEATTEPTEPPVLYRHPLTGQELDAPFVGRVSTATINNLRDAMPQSGIADADILFELETEGGITRMLGVFTDLERIEKLGPIRSARSYFNNINASFDGVLFHCGGSPAYALKGMYDDRNTLDNWVHINEQSYGSYFYRDRDRLSQGYSREHTLYTSGEKMIAALEAAKQNTRTELDFGFRFDDAALPAGDAAQKITVTFRGKKTTVMTYNAETSRYESFQYGKDHIDANTGDVVSFRNVLVLHAKQWKNSAGYNSFYNLIGTGEGYFACNGQITAIKWSRESVTEPFAFTLSDGTPLTMGVGTSYIAITDLNTSLVFE